MTLRQGGAEKQLSVLNNLKKAIDLHQSGDLLQAEKIYRGVLEKAPEQPDALHLLGLILHQQGKHAGAIDLITRAIKLKPTDPVYYSNLGSAFHGLGRLNDALVCYQKSLSIEPNYAETYINLGNVLKEVDQVEKAASCYRKAIALDPQNPQSHTALGNILQMLGRCDEAIACHRQALSLKPDYDLAYSNLLLAMRYMENSAEEDVFKEHRGFSERFEAPLIPHWQPHLNPRDPDKKIKVGYVSGDFHNHSLSYFFEPILACHDKSSVEIYCYHNNIKQDENTKKIADLADHWLVCDGMDDDALAERVRSDGIDILVDLSGHTGLNRLKVFARKPAPVQATWMGYPGTTGLIAMDYRITDAFLDPPGLTEHYHTEQLLRLPDIGAAYRPQPGCPEVNPLPALTNGFITFASLNNSAKLNPALIHVWSSVLSAVPGSRLVLGNMTDQALQQDVTGLFANCGIPSERLVMLPRVSLEEYFSIHHQIDIGLDTFPYNGGTTTIHALWMGVPVVTLAGSTAISRQGLSLLSRVGLVDFIAQDHEQYVSIAVQFANNPMGLNRVRQNLRQKVNGGSYAPEIITRHLETAYRQMWRKWCAS